MNPDWNLEPVDDDCEKCASNDLDECYCKEPDWEVYDE